MLMLKPGYFKTLIIIGTHTVNMKHEPKSDRSFNELKYNTPYYTLYIHYYIVKYLET